MCQLRDQGVRAAGQVIALKRVSRADGDRYRLSVSDGRHVMQALLNAELNALVQDNKLAVLTIVRLDNYTLHPVEGTPIAAHHAAKTSPC